MAPYAFFFFFFFFNSYIHSAISIIEICHLYSQILQPKGGKQKQDRRKMRGLINYYVRKGKWESNQNSKIPCWDSHAHHQIWVESPNTNAPRKVMYVAGLALVLVQTVECNSGAVDSHFPPKIAIRHVLYLLVFLLTFILIHVLQQLVGQLKMSCIPQT